MANQCHSLTLSMDVATGFIHPVVDLGAGLTRELADHELEEAMALLPYDVIDTPEGRSICPTQSTHFTSIA